MRLKQLILGSISGVLVLSLAGCSGGAKTQTVEVGSSVGSSPVPDPTVVPAVGPTSAPTDVATPSPEDEEKLNKARDIASKAKQKEKDNPGSYIACLNPDGTLSGDIEADSVAGAPPVAYSTKTKEDSCAKAFKGSRP